MSQNSTTSSVDPTEIEFLSEEFLQMSLLSNPELQLKYRMLAFIYHRDYLKFAHLSWIWREFLAKYPDIALTDMELKLEFCLRVMPSIDDLPFMDPAQRFYFKGRVFNENAEELLTRCDLEPGLDFVAAAEAAASVIPFDMETFIHNTNIFGPQSEPVPFQRISNNSKKGPQDGRSLAELLKSVFLTPKERENGVALTEDDVNNRIQDGFEKNCDFNAFLQAHFKEMEGEEMRETPILETPGFQGATTSTPLTHHVGRTQSQPVLGRNAREVRARPRATSAERSGESLNRFKERLNARSKPRVKPRGMRN